MPGPSQARQSYLKSQGVNTPSALPDADPILRNAAVIAGIIMGDDPQGDETLPADAPKPIPTSDPQYRGEDPNSFDAILKRHQNGAEKQVQAPDNGGTIYSGSFAHDLLAALNMPVTFENVRFINAWMRAETGDQGPGTPAFNPLATTQNYGSYSIFNKVGVKNYSDYHTGVMATADVLVRQPKNAGILAALARGNDANAAARAVSGSGWGTGDGVLKVLGG
jgi:hypothetical protein